MEQNLEGEITSLDPNEKFGVINNNYLFSTENVSPDLKKGSKIKFRVKQDEQSSLWIVTSIEATEISTESIVTQEVQGLLSTTTSSNTVTASNSAQVSQYRGPSIPAGENVFKQLLEDKMKIRILPRGTIYFKTRAIGTVSSEEVTIENNGGSSVFITRVSTARTQDVARFHLLNPEELPIDLAPHRSRSFMITCTPLQMGRTKELIIFEFNFNSFKIGRWLWVHSVDPQQDKILVCKPEKCKFGRHRRDELVAKLMMEKKMAVSAVRRFVTATKMKANGVPVGLLNCYRKKSNDLLLALYPSLARELEANNYLAHFKVSLWLEEVHNEVTRRHYDLQGVVLKRVGVGDLYSLEVPEIKDFLPPIWMGDIVMVYESLASSVMYKGPIMDINFDNEDLPTIRIQLSQKFTRMYDGGPCVVQFCLGRTPFKRMHFAVEQAVKHLGKGLLFPTELILKEPRIYFFEDEHENLNTQAMPSGRNGQMERTNIKARGRIMKPLQEEVARSSYLDSVKLRWYNHTLNCEQKDAVRRILKGQSRPLPYIIFGPPGTGKTVTVVEAILQVYILEPISRILVATPSNASTDLIVEHLVATNRFSPGDLVRLNGFHRAGASIPESIQDYCEDGTTLSQVVQKRVIICTAATAGQFFQLNLRKGHFTHVFIDEAGCCTEPETMIPCVLSITDQQSQVVLVGDPEQLGPVLMCDFKCNKVLQRSFLERILTSTKVYARDEEKFPETKYNPAMVTKLVKSYRAHPILLKLPSQMFYCDELVSCARREDAFDVLPFLPKQGVPLIFHGVDGNCDHDADSSPSWFNSGEVFQVIAYVKLLRENGLQCADIGIITPYRKQVEKIRVALKMMLPDGATLPRVASVEQFQGAERKVMIISTVRSYSEDIIEGRLSRLDFLYSKKRFNVAITRAKALMIVIGNPVVLSYNTYWRQLLEYCDELGVLTGCPIPTFIDSRWVTVINDLEISSSPSLIGDGVEARDESEGEEEYCCNEEDGAMGRFG